MECSIMLRCLQNKLWSILGVLWENRLKGTDGGADQLPEDRNHPHCTSLVMKWTCTTYLQQQTPQRTYCTVSYRKEMRHRRTKEKIQGPTETNPEEDEHQEKTWAEEAMDRIYWWRLDHDGVSTFKTDKRKREEERRKRWKEREALLQTRQRQLTPKLSKETPVQTWCCLTRESDMDAPERNPHLRGKANDDRDTQQFM